MAQELDIFQSTIDSNDSFENILTPSGPWDWTPEPENEPPPVIQGEDGNMYLTNAEWSPSTGWTTDPDFSTPVYYFTQPLELGDARGNYYDVNEEGIVEQQGFWRTEEEIKGYWDAEQGMGYFKEANPDLDYDTWFSFVKESSALDAQGLNRIDNPEEYNALVDQYGISTEFQNEDGDFFQWNGSGFTKTFKVDDSVPVGDMIMSVAIGAMTAGVLGPGGMGLVGGGFSGGATTGVVGSALSQGIINGKIDPKTLVTAGVLGGLGGWFSEMTSATPGAYGGWVDSAGNQLGPGTQWFMEQTQTLANTLGISFNEASGITQGIMEGTVSGQDLEGIALSAVGGFSNVKIQQYLTKTFGNGFDVENWFREGNSYIPTEALFPFVKRGIQAAIDGGISDLDLAKSIYGFFNAGGDLDFVLPGGLDFPSWISSLDIPNPCDQFPDMPYLCKSGPKVHGVDICSDEQLASGAHEVRIGNQDSWYCNLSGVGGGISICSPEQLAEGGIEIKVGDPDSWFCQMPDGPTVPELTCPDLNVPNGVQKQRTTSLGECVPDVIECIEGFDLVGQECVKAENPFAFCDKPRPTEMGFAQVNWDRYCSAPEIKCPAGFKNENGKCLEITCEEEGQVYNTELGKCVDSGTTPETPETPDIPGLPDVDVPSISFGSGTPGAGMFSPLSPAGLNYQPVTPVAIQQTPPNTAAADLDAFIARALGSRKDTGTKV